MIRDTLGREVRLLWAPLWLGLGIGIYFGLGQEPALWSIPWLCVASLVGLVGTLWFRHREGLAFGCFGVALTLLGLGLAAHRSASVAAPVIEFRYYGPIEGRIVAIDRSASDAVRLTLDQVRLADVAPDRTPKRVRISLHGNGPHVEPQIGLTIALTGHLSPPPGPVEPGGFDFQRHAWFLGLGGMGYTRTPTVVVAEAAGGLGIDRFRRSLTVGLIDAIPGEAGGIAAAITTGDRSALDAETADALRRSNLAHLLAISGLHMGLLTGLVFLGLRRGLALVPWLALHWPTKKIAAAGALAVGLAYLLISGGSVATQRAFVMVAVMLVAVLLGRRAISLRSVAVAAMIILVLRPEALMGPGFQMSFAATTALVITFGMIRLGQRWWSPVASLLLASFVAGLATAPFAALHFNQIPHYGLIANLLSVPAMGIVVMPAALLAAALWPLGLHGLGLWIMARGIDWIVWVANWVSRWDGAVSHVPSPGALVLPLIAMACGLAVVLTGRARIAAAAPMAAALALWMAVERPAILIAETGGLIGVQSPSGRVLSKPRGDGFTALAWLENDGAPVPQEEAAARLGFEREGRLTRIRAQGLNVLHVGGQRALDALNGCGGADILVLTVEATGERPCLVLDPPALRQTGAIAVTASAGQGEGLPGHILRSAREVSGARYWSDRATRSSLFQAAQ